MRLGQRAPGPDGRDRDVNAGMSDEVDDNRTEGPEGYFVQGPAPSHIAREHRSPPAGRRAADANLMRARKRLIWAYASCGAILAVGVLTMVAAWRE